MLKHILAYKYMQLLLIIIVEESLLGIWKHNLDDNKSSIFMLDSKRKKKSVIALCIIYIYNMI